MIIYRLRGSIICIACIALLWITLVHFHPMTYRHGTFTSLTWHFPYVCFPYSFWIKPLFPPRLISLVHAMSSLKAIDVWMQHPTKRFLTDSVFTSLHRWNRMDPTLFENAEHPVYNTGMSLASMDAGSVDLALACAWYSPDGPMISNEDVRRLCETNERFFGVASGDIRDPVRCVSGIKHYVQKHGFVAVRILPWLWERYADDPLFYPIYTACVELGVPLCLQAGILAGLFSSHRDLQRVALPML